MKTLFLCFSIYLVLNFISALNTFNGTLEQHHQQQVQSNNVSNIHHYGELINTRSINNRFAQQNRSRLQRGKFNQLQENRLNTTQVNPIINNRAIHPKFRQWPPVNTNNKTQLSLSNTTAAAILKSNISSIIKNNVQLDETPLKADRQILLNITQSSALLQIFTPKPQLRERISFADSYFQQRLRSFFGHQHDNATARTRPYIRTGLR